MLRQAQTSAPLLTVEDLHVHFATSRGIVRAVEGMSFEVGRGEVLAIVGEFRLRQVGIGALDHAAAAGYTARVPKGRIVFDGKSLLDLDDEHMRQLRGRDISMIFQEPMTSLIQFSPSDCKSPSRCKSISA